tara:strand:- start:1888 stop:2274 length:387 start_codon:yes stop_codon:yes gene_type:complete
MASVTTSALTELGGKFVLNRAVAAGNASLNALSGGGTIYLIEIDNEANSSAMYLKIADGTSATPSNGATNGAGTPDYTFIAPAYTKMCYSVPGGIALSTGLSYWVTSSTSVGTTTEPPKDVIVKMLCG